MCSGLVQANDDNNKDGHKTSMYQNQIERNLPNPHDYKKKRFWVLGFFKNTNSEELQLW